MRQALKLAELAQTAPVDAMNALTIRLDDELFAVEAHHVREILELVPITEVPNAPEFVGGLINVRFYRF